MTSDNELTNWGNKELSIMKKIYLKKIFMESYDIINTYLDTLYEKNKLTVADIKTETLLNELINEAYISVFNMITDRTTFELFNDCCNDLIYQKIMVAYWYIEKAREEDKKAREEDTDDGVKNIIDFEIYDETCSTVTEFERIFLQIYLYRNKKYIRSYIIKKATYNLRHL